MDKNIEDLIKEFKKISNKGWIKSTCNSTGSIGLTFEKELKKNPDNKYIPDFRDIEIKCTSFYTSYPIGLFSIAFDGPTFPEINRIVEKYGYYDKTYNNKKVIFANINNKKTSIVNKKCIFKLDIDYKDNKVYLCVYDLYNNLIERKSYIYIDTLYNHINLKIKKMAIIYGVKEKKQDISYFNYYSIHLYKLKSLEDFVLALKEGIIFTKLAVNTYKSGYRQGKTRNKNLTFYIYKKNISRVFDEIYTYNHNKNND